MKRKHQNLDSLEAQQDSARLTQLHYAKKARDSTLQHLARLKQNVSLKDD